MGTICFAIIERIRIPVKAKVLVMTFLHPIVTAVLTWLTLSTLNKELANTCVVMLAGAMTWGLFSNTRYLCEVTQVDEKVFLKYLTPLLRQKSINWNRDAEFQWKVSKGGRLVDKPLTVEVIQSERSQKYYVLDSSISLSNINHS